MDGPEYNQNKSKHRVFDIKKHIISGDGIPAYPSRKNKLEIKLLNHQQRVLTSSSDTNNPDIISLNSAKDEIFQIKYPPIPSFVGIGPEKCGTTSMAYMLSRNSEQIPEIIKPVHEPTGIDCEMRVWLPCGNKDFKQSLNNVLRDGVPTKGENYCSLGWYQHFWPPHHDDVRYLHYYLNYMNTSQSSINNMVTSSTSSNGTHSNGTNDKLFNIFNSDKIEYDAENPLTWKWKYYYYFEKSPAYWCYEHVAYLFNKLLVPQGTKFFVMMRDPIKRTYSYWSHQTQIGHLNGKWPQFIQNSLNNPHIKNMVTLLEDDSRTIMEIKDDLLREWKEYVYDKPYGYIGRRDGEHGKKGPNIYKGNRKRAPRPKRPKGGRRKPLNVDKTNINTLKDEILEQWNMDKRGGRRLFEEMQDEWNNNNNNNNNNNIDVNISNSTRRRLWTQKDPGYITADTNPQLGVGASCYIVPLLMWLEYIPSTQLVLMQSELMYGGNHDNFINDVRCWYSLGYEYETMDECKDSKKKKVKVSEEHLTGSAKGKIQDGDARELEDGLYKWCNKRLMELLEMDEYKHMALHEIRWDGWYS